jgi:predicted TIM-barrel fold metal-dependent hydrolase
MIAEARTFLSKQLEYLEQNEARLTVDADTHITDLSRLPQDLARRVSESNDYFHGRPMSAEMLLAAMDVAGVDMALSWQNPAATEYGDDVSANYDALLAANRYVAESARQHPTRIIPAGWTDPRALGIKGAVELARHCVSELGMGIVKMNPAQNEFPMNGPEAMEVAGAIVDAGAVPAFHYGADTPYTPAEAFAEMADQFPHSPLIGVHMGGGGAAYVAAEELYQKSRTLGLEHENIHFVFSAKRDVHIESDLITYQLAGSPYKDNLSCGSDAPYGNLPFHFGGYRSLLNSFLYPEHHPDPRVRENSGLFDESSIRGYLGQNFVRLVMETYASLLSRG